MRQLYAVGLVLICLAYAGGVCSAQEAGATAPKVVEEAVTRTYDINFLIEPQPYFALPAREGFAPASLPADDQEPTDDKEQTKQNVEQVIRMIQETVDSESWKDNGGMIGTIQELNGTLIVTQTASGHAKVQKCLSELIANQSHTFSIRVYWLQLSPQEARTLFAARKSTDTLATVPEAMLDDAHLYAAAQTTCLNRQGVHVVTDHRANYVSDVTPIVEAGAVGYQPGSSESLSGVRLQLYPSLLPPGDRVAVDVQSIISEAGPAPVGKAAPATNPSMLSIDRMNGFTTQFRTTARLPLAQNILVGGMTLDPAKDGQPPRQIFLVVNVESIK